MGVLQCPAGPEASECLGEGDLSCPHGGLCCFNGCVHVCIEGLGPPTTQPAPGLSEEDSPPLPQTPSVPGECPAPPAPGYSTETCEGTVSTCLSPGHTDTDCPSNGLCCFDGCVDSCLDVDVPETPYHPAHIGQQRQKVSLQFPFILTSGKSQT